MAIKYTPELNKEISRVVNRYNAKVKRLSRNNYSNLPSLTSVKDIKAKVINKRDLTRELKYLGMFNQRGSERLIETQGGALISRYEYEILELEQKRLYNKLSRDIKRYGSTVPTIFGIRQDSSYSLMGDEKYSNMMSRRKYLGHFKLHNLNKAELRKLEQLVAKTNENYRHEDAEFYEWYLSYGLGTIGLFFGLDIRKINHIIEKLKELTPNQFIRLYETEITLRSLYQRYKDKNILPYGSAKEETKNVIDELYNNIDTIVEEYK